MGVDPGLAAGAQPAQRSDLDAAAQLCGDPICQLFYLWPWRDPESANFPQSAAFSEAMRLPMLGTTRVHLGLLIGLVAMVLIDSVLRHTRWGYTMRAIGGNAEAAQRHGLPIQRYILITMFVAGGLAGLAGVGETMAIQGRLRPGFSPGYGYIGFLVSWLAAHNPYGALGMATLMSIIALGGDTLQITQSHALCHREYFDGVDFVCGVGQIFREEE